MTLSLFQVVTPDTPTRSDRIRACQEEARALQRAEFADIAAQATALSRRACEAARFQDAHPGQAEVARQMAEALGRFAQTMTCLVERAA